MPHPRPLSDFPKLKAWYHKACTLDGDCRTIPDFLSLKTCAVLASDPSKTSLKSWILTMTESFTASADLRRDFLSIVSHFHDQESDFAELLGDLTHTSVTIGLGELLLPALQLGADKSQIAALRFLAAWTALNCNQPEICISECEKVDEPFAPIHSLQGQAYLEIGNIKDALEALDVATALAPSDAVAWFQKSKTLHIMNRPREAFESLRECENIAPHNDEVAFMMAIVVLDSELESDVKEYAWKKLRTHLGALGHVPQVPFNLLRLSMQLGDKTKALDVTNAWSTSTTLHSSDELHALTEILRELQTRNWMDVAQKLLEKVRIDNTGYVNQAEHSAVQKSFEKVSE